MKNIILNINNNEYIFKFIQVINVETIKRFTKEQLEKYKNEEGQYKYNKLVKSLENEGYTLDDITNIEFCYFKIDKSIIKSGVYIWVIDDEIKYIGSAKNLQERFNNGYGVISPRNIFYKGQSTNCKLNRVALKNINKKISIYFYETPNYKIEEKKILKSFKNNQQTIKWENLYNSKS